MQEEFRKLAKQTGKSFEQVHAAWDQAKAELKRVRPPLRGGPTYMGKLRARVQQLLATPAPAPKVEAPKAVVVEVKQPPAPKAVVNPLPDPEAK